MLLLKSVCTKPKTALPKRSASGGEGKDRRSGCEVDETAYSPNILTKSSDAWRKEAVSTPFSVIDTSANDCRSDWLAVSVLKRRRCARENFYLGCTEIRSHGRASLGREEGGIPCGRATRRACTTVGGAEERGHREERCQSGALRGCCRCLRQRPPARVGSPSQLETVQQLRGSYWTDKTPSQCLCSPSSSKND